MVLVDVAEARIVCVKPKAPIVALFQQVPRLQERDGCSHFAESQGCSILLEGDLLCPAIHNESQIKHDSP